MRRTLALVIASLGLAAVSVGPSVADPRGGYYGDPLPIAPQPRYEPRQAPRYASSDPFADLFFGAHRQPRVYQRDDGYAREEAEPVASTRQVVAYRGSERPGTIVISTDQRALYLVQPNGTALRYAIGVGRDGFQWGGVHTVTRKQEWPDWTPPAEMLKRRPDLPRHMAGGEDNPLGARALYLGSTLYRIHGSNEPETIGQAVSSGCFRMLNQDVVDLYDRVAVGAKVVVQR